MPRANRRYTNPEYELGRVHEAASSREIVITGKAGRDAVDFFPADLIDVPGEICRLVQTITAEEFEFSEWRSRQNAAGREVITWVDVYRFDFEGLDGWLKIKLEGQTTEEHVVVISVHEWDDWDE